jgi:hypothetical protein
MIFIPNRYTRIYYSVIERAQTRILPKDSYKEKHHVIPRCMGGSDDLTNIVELTFKEHVFCHKLLVKMTEGITRGRLAFAAVLMSGKDGSKICDANKKLLAEEMSRLHTGKIPITNGVIDKVIFKGHSMPLGFYEGFSPATIKKHGDGNKGKRWITDGVSSYQIKDDVLPEGFYWGQAEYHKKKNSEALSGSGNPMYGKVGINHPAYGYKHTSEDLLLLSESKKGNKNPMFGKIPANAKTAVIDGISYASMKEARLKTGLSRRQLENLYKEKK